MFWELCWEDRKQQCFEYKRFQVWKVLHQLFWLTFSPSFHKFCFHQSNRFARLVFPLVVFTPIFQILNLCIHHSSVSPLCILIGQVQKNYLQFPSNDAGHICEKLFEPFLNKTGANIEDLTSLMLNLLVRCFLLKFFPLFPHAWTMVYLQILFTCFFLLFFRILLKTLPLLFSISFWRLLWIWLLVGLRN